MVYHILFRRWPKYPAQFAFDMFTTLDDDQIVSAMSSICKGIHTDETPADRAKPAGYLLPNSGTIVLFPGNRVFIYGVQREESAREIVRFLNERFRDSPDHPHFAYIADSALSDADRQSMRQEADLVDRGRINVASLNRSDYAIAVLASLAAKDHDAPPTLSKGSQAAMPISSGSLLAMPGPEPYDDLESLPIKPEHRARLKALPEPMRKNIRKTVKPDLLGHLFNIVDSQSTRTVIEKLILVIDILHDFKRSVDSGRGLDSLDRHVFLNVAILILWDIAAPAAEGVGVDSKLLMRWATEPKVEEIGVVCDQVRRVIAALKHREQSNSKEASQKPSEPGKVSPPEQSQGDQTPKGPNTPPKPPAEGTPVPQCWSWAHTHYDYALATDPSLAGATLKQIHHWLIDHREDDCLGLPENHRTFAQYVRNYRRRMRLPGHRTRARPDGNGIVKYAKDL